MPANGESLLGRSSVVSVRIKSRSNEPDIFFRVLVSITIGGSHNALRNRFFCLSSLMGQSLEYYRNNVLVSAQLGGGGDLLSINFGYCFSACCDNIFAFNQTDHESLSLPYLAELLTTIGTCFLIHIHS